MDQVRAFDLTVASTRESTRPVTGSRLERHLCNADQTADHRGGPVSDWRRLWCIRRPCLNVRQTRDFTCVTPAQRTLRESG
jgi:hypothetical protein